MLKLLILAAAVALLLACDTSGDDAPTGGECPHADQAIGDASALPHGSQCTSDADCQYGQCVNSELVSGFNFKFCTKQCSCGENSQCSQDGAGLTCLRYGPSYPNEPYTAFCAPTCTSVSDCASLGPYTACDNIDGAGIKDVCVVQ